MGDEEILTVPKLHIGAIVNNSKPFLVIDDITQEDIVSVMNIKSLKSFKRMARKGIMIHCCHKNTNNYRKMHHIPMRRKAR